MLSKTITVNCVQKNDVSAQITVPAEGTVLATYDGAAHTVTAGLGGGLDGSHLSYSYTTADGTLVSGQPVGAGTYTVTVTYSDADNYTA